MFEVMLMPENLHIIGILIALIFVAPWIIDIINASTKDGDK